KPETFLVEMFPGTVKDSIMTIVNDGGGTLAWELTIEDVTPLTGSRWVEPQSGASPSGSGSGSDPVVDQSNPAHLTRL
ncbi:MAG: hypothetical protein GTO63_19085, partial [Anaerolineae bacterium]|nr:hypothetical protein [Anaerolineae bacterium]NIN96880.1 hypothetical protein [Anaerolineae bacterium]NIQ79859.1 hypothetical protein [Anaerolineae bacterium]